MTSPPADELLPDPHDAVLVAGPEAEAFLQGQLSQDVTKLAVGEWAWSFVLAPDGKLDATLRVHRTDDDAFELLCDAGFGDAVAGRLGRFKLRTDCEITLDTGRAGHAVAERRRIEAGLPRMGLDLQPGDLAATSGLVPHAVDFAKGCFVGQELVARMDSRGGTAPIRLVRLRGEGTVARGDAVLDAERIEVGELTSVAGEGGEWVALARVSRKLTDAAVVGGTSARVEELG